MSYALDQEDDQPNSQVDEKDPSEAISLGGGGSGTASPGGGNVGGSGQAAQTAAAKPSSSGSWTNLQSYLDANAGQGDQVGSQIAGSVNQQGQTAQNDINNASSDFTNNVNANTVQQDSTGVAKDISDATGAKAGSTQDPNDVSNFQSQANASYGGPTDFTQDQYYGQAQQDANTATQAADETGSEAGREVLLGDQYNNASQNGYNQGEQNLDQMLLENSSGAQAALSPLASQWGGLNTALGTAATSGDAAAAAGVTTDQATAAAANQALQAGIATGTTNINSELTAGQAAQDANYQAIEQGLENGNLSAAQLQALGLTPGQQDYGVTNTQIASFLNPEGAPLNVNQTATTDNYAEAAALAALASGQSYASTANLGLTGTAPASAAPGPTYNVGGFNADVSVNQASLQQADKTQSNAIYQALGQDANLRGLQGAPGPNAPMAQQIAFWQPILNNPTTMNQIDTGVNVPWWGQIQDAINKYAAAQGLYSGTLDSSVQPTGPGAGAINGGHGR